MPAFGQQSMEEFGGGAAQCLMRPGLKVHAELDDNSYPTGIKISNNEMKTLDDNGVLTRHEFHGDWNYTLQPTNPT